MDALAIGALAFKDYLGPDDANDQLNITDKAALVEAVQAHLSDWSEDVGVEFDAAEAAGQI